MKLSLRQAEILEQLAKDEELLKQGGGVPDLAVGSCKYVCPLPLASQGANGNPRDERKAPTFHPEFGRFMLEATPGKPWGIDFKDLLNVEADMKWRYHGCSCGHTDPHANVSHPDERLQRIT